MWGNCAGHFRAALEILEPTLIVVQGLGIRRWLAPVLDLSPKRSANPIEPVQIGKTPAILFSLSHPAAHAPLNWGSNEKTSYLLQAVKPAVESALRILDRP